MKKTRLIICIVILISVLLSACSYVGDADFAMFREHFNKANDDIQLEDTNVMLEKETDFNKYCCFFNAGKNSDYLITVYEKKDISVVSTCTLSILKSSDLNIRYVEDLFCSMLYGYNEIEEDKAKEIFKKLELDNKTTYLANKKTDKEFDKLKVTVVTNGVGTAITVK